MKTLDPDLLLRAYSIGVFPMSDGRDAKELYWVEPRHRAIIPLNGFHLSRSLRKSLRSGAFEVTTKVTLDGAKRGYQQGGLVVEMTDGTAEYNRSNYRLSIFYDLVKTSVQRMAWALGKELAPHGATAVALTPGWLRSEMMLAHFGVTEERWRDATAAQPHFIISESPRYVGRAVVALAADAERGRWNGSSLSSGELAKVYGFRDVDGSQPDCWRYMTEVVDAGKPADPTGYR